jgi:HSP20 family protein
MEDVAMNLMNVQNLMPWRNRGRNLPASRAVDSELNHPFYSLHREMNRLFDDFVRGFDLPMTSAFAGMGGGWPNIEVSEDEKAVKVCAELPGLEDKDVELTLQEGVLTLKGEKKTESDQNGYSERWHGRFERSIHLGPDVNPDKAKAAFRNGVLTVTVEKRPEADSKAKRIPIQA